MHGFFFRYSRFSYNELQNCLNRNIYLDHLKSSLAHHTELLNKARPLLKKLPEDFFPGPHAWLENPTIKGMPNKKIISKIRINVPLPDKSLYALYDWAEEFIHCFNSSLKQSDQALHEEMLQFMNSLAKTRFPVLLLWDQPIIASRFFKVNDNIEVNSSIIKKSRKLRQASFTCMAYCFSAVSRWMPRAAWIGSGFGRVVSNSPNSSPPFTIQEKIHIEPDLAWFDRNWTDLNPMVLEPGILPWDYLRQRITQEPNIIIQSKYLEILEKLESLANQIKKYSLDFNLVHNFIFRTEELLFSTVDPLHRQTDPHHWWITSVTDSELELDITNVLQFSESRKTYQDHLEKLNIRQSDTNKTPINRLPLPLTLLSNYPQHCQLKADEMIDWFFSLDKQCFLDLDYLKLIEEPGTILAQVFAVTEEGIRFMYSEPNPARIADRLACYYHFIPYYIELCRKNNATSIKPPDILIDNRLIRLASEETPAADLKPGDTVEYRSSLFSDNTQKLMMLELNSPHYKNAPDLLPIIATSSVISISYGKLYVDEKIWYLSETDIHLIIKELKNAQTIALFYYLELAETMGHCSWLDVVVEGKRSSVFIDSLLTWHYIIHLLRTCSSAVLFTKPVVSAANELITLDNGEMNFSAQFFCI